MHDPYVPVHMLGHTRSKREEDLGITCEQECKDDIKKVFTRDDFRFGP